MPSPRSDFSMGGKELRLGLARLRCRYSNLKPFGGKGCYWAVSWAFETYCINRLVSPNESIKSKSQPISCARGRHWPNGVRRSLSNSMNKKLPSIGYSSISKQILPSAWSKATRQRKLWLRNSSAEFLTAGGIWSRKGGSRKVSLFLSSDAVCDAYSRLSTSISRTKKSTDFARPPKISNTRKMRESKPIKMLQIYTRNASLSLSSHFLRKIHRSAEWSLSKKSYDKVSSLRSRIRSSWPRVSKNQPQKCNACSQRPLSVRAWSHKGTGLLKLTTGWPKRLFKSPKK